MSDRAATTPRRPHGSCAVISVCVAGALLVAAHSAQAASPPLTIAIADRSLQPGELIVVRIERLRASTTARTDDRALTDVRVHAFGRNARAFEEHGAWTALVGIDLEQHPGPYTLSASAHLGSIVVTAQQTLIVRAKRFATRTLNVAPEFVNPPAATAARIAGDISLLNAAYAHSDDERLWRRPFIRPVPQQANSRFGQRSRFNGELRSPHSGTDFMSPAGTPVKAPSSGRVVIARDLYFTGNTVVIDHGLGVFSMLAHLSRMDVQEGQRVNGGDAVGLVGATGRVTGPHLHWAMRVDGARVDALSALALLGDDRGAGR